jgi:hypothetical protein
MDQDQPAHPRSLIRIHAVRLPTLFIALVAHMGESSKSELVILDFGGQCRIQKDAPVPEAFPDSLTCQVLKLPYT